MMDKRKLNVKFSSDQEFEKVFMDCMSRGPQASDEVKGWLEKYETALDNYLGELAKFQFRYGYECGCAAVLEAYGQKVGDGHE